MKNLDSRDVLELLLLFPVYLAREFWEWALDLLWETNHSKEAYKLRDWWERFLTFPYGGDKISLFLLAIAVAIVFSILLFVVF